MSNILREIDEDLRKEKLLKLWKKYGIFSIIAITLIILMVIGYQLQSSFDLKKNQELVELYMDATTKESVDDTILLLNSFDELDHHFISGLAALKTADLLIKQNKDEESLFVLEKIINNKKHDPIIADLANYLFLMIKIEDTDKEFFKYLNESYIENSKFKYLYHELLAIRKILLGDAVNGRNDFELLLKDNSTPIEIQNRAKKFIKISKYNDG